MGTGSCRQTYTNGAVRQELAASTLGDVGRILFVSPLYLVRILSYPSRIPFRLLKNPRWYAPPRKTLYGGGVRGEPPQPLPVYHTSRNPPGWPESPPLQASRV